MTIVNNRYDFVLLFDVTDGNPNGDPEAGDMPRTDPETLQGFVTDVALKRKVRDFIHSVKGDQPPHRIYVQHEGRGGKLLEELHTEAHDAIGTNEKSRKNPPRDIREEAKRWMCQNFWDVRSFGAVMSLDVNAGQVRGPLQLTFARSIDPVLTTGVAITRVIRATARRAARGGTAEMGSKNVVPYGLYRAHGFVSPSFAKDTGFTEEDLELFWQALLRMFEDDRSASRGLMATRELVVFRHESRLGNAPAHELFDRVSVKRLDPEKAARRFEDYAVSIDDTALPSGVSVLRPAPRYGEL